MAATPYEILAFVGRGTSVRDHDRLKAGLDRLQSTTVLTSIRQPAERRRHRFSWINEWKEAFDANGCPFGLGMRPRLRSLAVRESTGGGCEVQSLGAIRIAREHQLVAWQCLPADNLAYVVAKMLERREAAGLGMEVHEIKAPATVLAVAVLAHEPVEPALEPARQIEIGGRSSARARHR